MINKNKLYDFLHDLNILYTIYNHPPVFTVAQAAELANNVPGASCKNLFLKDSKKRFWLIVACANTKIELKKLSKNVAAPELRFGSAECLQEMLGVLPGSVTPFGLIHDNAKDMTVLFDNTLLQH